MSRCDKVHRSYILCLIPTPKGLIRSGSVENASGNAATNSTMVRSILVLRLGISRCPLAMQVLPREFENLSS
jgi:hypothetical protein